jgi:hypothetical protein
VPFLSLTAPVLSPPPLRPDRPTPIPIIHQCRQKHVAKYGDAGLLKITLAGGHGTIRGAVRGERRWNKSPSSGPLASLSFLCLACAGIGADAAAHPSRGGDRIIEDSFYRGRVGPPDEKDKSELDPQKHRTLGPKPLFSQFGVAWKGGFFAPISKFLGPTA